MSHFFLSGEVDSGLRLKSFSATNRGGKSTIRIELETADPYELGYALSNLSEVQKAQRAPKPPPASKVKAPRRLALPAPCLALPAPDGEGEA